MNIALIGYGKMGKEIESLLLKKGHNVPLIIDIDNSSDLTEANMRLKQIDVAVEFTTPSHAFGNVSRCLEWNIPVVCGTTGWQDKLDDAKRLCVELGGTFFYASNFSVGVNIFFHLNEKLAGIMAGFPDYDVSMREIHHIHKKDAPSGTAVTLAEGIIANLDRKTGWINEITDEDNVLGIESVREGEVFGTHEISYVSVADEITLIHKANSRHGFATGVVMATEYVVKHKGVLSMRDLLSF